MTRRSLVRVSFVVGMVAFGVLVYLPQLVRVDPGVSYALFGAALLIALIAATISCEKCGAGVFRLPPSYRWIFSKHCPDCGLERI